MRLAVVGWAADSGVGRELIDALRHLPVSSAFILHNDAKKTRTDLITKVPYYLAKGVSRILMREMVMFLDHYKPDTILTWEVPGSWDFPDLWIQKGIRWIHVVHWDWFAPDYVKFWKKSILVSPNTLCKVGLKSHYRLDSTFLSVPVDTDLIKFRQRMKASLFVSMYGYGGLENRRSLPEIFRAWGTLQPPAPCLVLRAQCTPSEITGPLPAWIKLEVNNVPEPGDLWTTGDIAVQPSRYEGLGLGLMEAEASGVPVITTDAPPMNEIVRDLLVPVERVEKVTHMGRTLPSHVPNWDKMRTIIEGLRVRDISELSWSARNLMEKKFSWNALRSRWMALLEGK